MLHLSRSRIAAVADWTPQAASATAILSEVHSSGSRDGAATGFVLSRLAPRSGPVLWIQDRLSLREAGRPRPVRLSSGRLWRMELSHPRDVLIAAEEGLRCAALCAVVIDLYGDPPALDFTATKRLALRAADSGVPCWLIRHGATPALSAARDRWRLASLPSAPNPDDPAAPGAPRWRAELFRSRDGRPGEWVVHHDRAQDRVHFTAALPDGAVAAAVREDRRHAAR